MADQYSNEGSSKGSASVESSETTVLLNIKTLDSQVYSFQVDRNMAVSAFKEKIANQIGVPVGQQRLIFRGRVLKDEHLLSEYQVENGHTLHLVARQPARPQSLSDTGSREPNGNNISRGNDANAGASRNHVGQISHSVVLGTLNVGDQGEGIIPDLTRVIGAVLNSLGIGGQNATNGLSGMQLASSTNVTGQSPQGNETSGSHGNVAGQSQAGNQTVSSQSLPSQPFQSQSHAVPFPLTAALPIPSLHSPIPDSLSTLSEFMMRMEQALAQTGHQSNTSSTSAGNLPTVELPFNARGLPTPEALSIVLRHAERLLSGNTVAALSHIAGHLEQEGASPDPTIRGQIQAESVHVGLAMQHLGALLLELGRTILTLRMGLSPAESSVNTGPAVYISPSGPNPIMAQPFPLQTNSLLGGSVPPSNPMNFSPIGIGNASRHINIHIHAGTSLAPIVPNMGIRSSSGEGMHGEVSNGTGTGGSGSERPLLGRNVIAAAVPPRSTGIAVYNAAPQGLGVSISQPASDSVSLSAFLDEMNSHLRSVSGTRQGENQPSAGSVGSSAPDGVPSIVDQINSRIRSPTSNMQRESQPTSGSVGAGAHNDISSMVDRINSDIRSPRSNMQGEGHPASGTVGAGAYDDMPNIMANRAVVSSASLPGVMSESDGQKEKDEQIQLHTNETNKNLSSCKDAPSSSVDCSVRETSLKQEDTSEKASSSLEKHDAPEVANAVPLGLGLGGLERKRRMRQPPGFAVRSGDSGTSNIPLDQNQNTDISVQQLLQSLASRNSGTNRVSPSDNLPSQVPPFVGQAMENRPSGGLGSDGQFDISSAMSQVLQAPALNNLLAGLSEQTGVGSPDVLRNMMQQLTRSPQIMNTVNQMAQQVDSQDHGNVFSSLGSGQGGGIDLSRMIQQMMPVVSQVLGHGLTTPPCPSVEPEPQLQHNERRPSGGETPNDDIKIDLWDAAQRIEHFDAPEDVFNAVVENAVSLNANGGPEDILHELSNNEDLASDYVEMLQRDICRRLNGDSGREKC